MLSGICDKPLFKRGLSTWHIPCSTQLSCEQIPRVRSCAPRCDFPRFAALFFWVIGGETGQRSRGIESDAPSPTPVIRCAAACAAVALWCRTASVRCLHCTEVAHHETCLGYPCLRLGRILLRRADSPPGRAWRGCG